MTAPSDTTVTTDSSRLPTLTLGAGIIAAALTTIMGFISLVVGLIALVTGAAAWRKSGPNLRVVAGMSMAAVSIYAILTEIFIPDLGL